MMVVLVELVGNSFAAAIGIGIKLGLGIGQAVRAAGRFMVYVALVLQTILAVATMRPPGLPSFFTDLARGLAVVELDFSGSV